MRTLDIKATKWTRDDLPGFHVRYNLPDDAEVTDSKAASAPPAPAPVAASTQVKTTVIVDGGKVTVSTSPGGTITPSPQDSLASYLKNNPVPFSVVNGERINRDGTTVGRPHIINNGVLVQQGTFVDHGEPVPGKFDSEGRPLDQQDRPCLHAPLPIDASDMLIMVMDKPVSLNGISYNNHGWRTLDLSFG